MHQITEHRFTTWDGIKLVYRAWLPQSGKVDKAVLLFHRGHEHSGRWLETVQSLNLGDDFAVFAWDQRGHGQSPGERGGAENLAVVIKDADEFAKHICASHGIDINNVIVLAHSVGAVIATAWVHDYAPQIRGLILAVPAFRVKLYVPLAVPLLRMKQKFLGPGIVKSYVKARMLTHDPEQARAYQSDSAIFRQIAVNILLDLHDTGTRLLDDAAAITTPTLMLVATNDWVVKISAQQEFFRRLGSSVKQMETFEGFYHAIFHEAGRERVVARVRKFIDDCFAQPWRSDGLVRSDQGGPTKTEYDLLRSPGSGVWSLMRLWMKTFGRMSSGIDLGCKTGFDSGVTLDYVYENRPRGITPIGKLIDRSYLNAIGWRGIRQRKIMLERALKKCIDQMHAESRPVRILDIASGPGRYVMETMKAMPQVPISATLRDYKQTNLDAARQLSQTLGLEQVTIAHGDAFDRSSLAAVDPKPTIAIASGIYELFSYNQMVLRSLRGIADALEPGGHLIYTNQPWHPQVEFIARVLTNHQGQPWIMRRRTQAEMDALVREAGFEKISQEIDPWGIFTVSMAKKSR
jgi:alpha-beta hydrolase superfamily lysophospholipase/SAM-dependent methyltransferase